LSILSDTIPDTSGGGLPDIFEKSRLLLIHKTGNPDREILGTCFTGKLENSQISGKPENREKAGRQA
jgi:hypothetical protein